MLFTYQFLLSFHLLWLLVCCNCIYKKGYLQFLNACPFEYTAVAVSGQVAIGSAKQVKHNGKVTVIISFDRMVKLMVTGFFWCVMALTFLSFSHKEVFVNGL